MYSKSSWCIKQKLEENRLCELRECSDDGSGNSIMSLKNNETEEQFLIRMLDEELNKEVLNTDAILFILNRAEWNFVHPRKSTVISSTTETTTTETTEAVDG